MAYWALEALDGSKTALSSLDRVEGTDPPAYLPIAGPSGAVKTGPTYLSHRVQRVPTDPLSGYPQYRGSAPQQGMPDWLLLAVRPGGIHCQLR